MRYWRQRGFRCHLWRGLQSPKAPSLGVPVDPESVHSLMGAFAIGRRQRIGQHPVELPAEHVGAFVGIGAMHQDPTRPVHFPGGCTNVETFVQPPAQFDALDQGWIAGVKGVCLPRVPHRVTNIGPRIRQGMAIPEANMGVR